jgi:hypothetical protein
MNCSERDRLDASVAQATMEWTRLDQTPLPDVSIPGGLKEAEDLSRRRESAGNPKQTTDSIPPALPNASLSPSVSVSV